MFYIFCPYKFAFYLLQIKFLGYHNIVLIPIGASNIMIQQTSFDGHIDDNYIGKIINTIKVILHKVRFIRFNIYEISIQYIIS